MARPYSLDLRERAVRLAERGTHTRSEVARQLGIGEATLYDWLARKRAHGTLAPRPHGRGRRPLVEGGDLETLRALVREQNDRTLDELCDAYAERTGVRPSRSALWRALRRGRITRKKKTLSAAEQARPDVAAERAAFRATQPALDPTKLVFVDESGATTKMVRTHARSAKGERACGTAPARRHETLTFFGALSLAGVEAAMSLDGAADGDAVCAFVERVLVPTLVPGQVVFFDNLNAHKSPRIRALIEAAGCEMRFLPRYSPDLAPIEQAWSKIKAFLRSAAARTRAALDAAFAAAIERVSAADAAGWFAHCGYALAPE